MAYKCNECLYDCFTWCARYELETGCGDCVRLNSDGKCRCLLVDCNDCPDFVPKEGSDEKTDGENQAVAE